LKLGYVEREYERTNIKTCSGHVLWNFSEWIPIEIILFSLENTIETLKIIEQFRSESIPKGSIIRVLTYIKEVSLRIL